MNKPSGRKTITVEVTIPVDVEVTIGAEADDDGCGGPGRTGNCMTGFRGWFAVVEDSKVAHPAKLIEAIEAKVAESPEVQQVADDWEDDDGA